MKDQESNENWQLEEGNQVDDRWVLRESEQRLANQWELNQADDDEPIQDWQPVEYSRPERSPAAWILPILITVFLLVLIGYSGFILLPQIINPPVSDPIAATTETPTPAAEAPTDQEPATDEADAPAVPQPESPSEPDPAASAPDGTQPDAAEPDDGSAAPIQPDPVEDEPVALPAIVEQDFATVITTYGVNSRAEPSADGEIVRVLNQAESFFLFGSPAEGWLEILVTDEDVELVQGEPIQGRVAYAASEFFDIAPQPIMRDLYDEILEFAGRTPVEPIVESEPDDEPAETPDETPTDPPVPPVTAPQEVTVRVDSAAGLNVRSAADTTGNIVGVLNEGDVVIALAYSDDQTWIQVQLEDGAIGWIFGEFATVLGDPSLIGASPLPPAAVPVVIDATEVVTSGIVPPAPFSSIIPGDTPAVVVAVAAGAIARVQPNALAQELTLLPQGAALPAIGRTADGQWIQVELPDGNLSAWVSRSVLSVTSDIDTAPVEGEAPPADETPILLPTPTPAPAAADASDSDAVDDASDSDAVDDASDSATATVRDILLSVYAQPTTEGNPIALIQRNTVVSAIGRTPAGDWIRIETDAGDAGWAPARSVIVSVDVALLPVIAP